MPYSYVTAAFKHKYMAIASKYVKDLLDVEIATLTRWFAGFKQ